jgi:predicted transcriptional regulator
LSNRIQALKERVARLRLSNKLISERSGLDETTLGRTFLGHTDPLTSTLDRIEAVIAEEEQQLREALLKGAAA